ncbi:3-isopropylmalate dehydratase [Haliangium sp.]|uniref:LeuD/DmdB family oxidoreductase small subunit n=1 Tax=Haliangium sp. TaxID=2663208 RepID=UPI003D1398D5
MNISGRVYRLAPDMLDNVNTDAMIAGRYLRIPKEELGAHAFEGVIDDFPAIAEQHPVLVGGANMGCGSSREQAVHALRGSGVKLVIAQSFGYIFFRNSLNLGLALLQVPDRAVIEALATGDEVEVDLASGTLIRAGTPLWQGAPLPEHLLQILGAGGILSLLRTNPGALVQ